jgi:hypothetical protein
MSKNIILETYEIWNFTSKGMKKNEKGNDLNKKEEKL